MYDRARRRNKYGARKTAYNGTIYDSAREAHWARMFDLLRRANDDRERVMRVERQVDFLLSPSPNKIIYRLDFKVTYFDGAIRYYEIKGYETPAWKIKKKLMAEKYPDIEIRILR